MGKQEAAKKWATALRSGKYGQCKGLLQNTKGFCCLGVLVKEFVSETKQIRRQSNKKFLAGAALFDQPSTPSVAYKVVREMEAIECCPAYMNDSLNMSFAEIADVIEAVVIHKVLE